MNIHYSRNAGDDICEDCGAIVKSGKSGCLKLFEEILAKEFSDYRYGKIHRLTVDTYSLQHPDVYMRSGKSFAAHLTGICAALEYENATSVNQAVQQWLNTNPEIEKPALIPKHRGNLTITFINPDMESEEYVKRVQEWAQDVWSAWKEHHGLARHLIDIATAKNK